MEDAHKLVIAKAMSEDFHRGYEICMDTSKKHFPELYFPAPSSALILAALSIEIVIKSYLMQHGHSIPKTHNLRILLDLLPRSVKLSAISEVSLKFQDFDGELQKAENAFIDFRYPYELKRYKEVNVRFLGALSAALQIRIGLDSIQTG